MYVVLAWFADRPVAEGALWEARSRFDAAVARLVPQTYVRHDLGGIDWGLTVLHVGESAYRWPVLSREGPTVAVSMGIPVGLDVSGGPVLLARRLLDGDDIHTGVVPPFGLIALDGVGADGPAAGETGGDGSDRAGVGGGPGGRVAVQQDWLGMCRIFKGGHDGITAFASRPGLLAAFLHGRATPDYDGWASYAVTGHFGASMSPLSGIRLLHPGERVTGRRQGRGWALWSQLRPTVDDLVTAGLAARGDRFSATLEAAEQGLTSTAVGIRQLYPDEITIGLSGGKDSRLIAASFLTAGQLPRLHTNDDLAAEGETARQLVQLVRERRGLRPEHTVAPAGAPANVLRIGLRDRVSRMQYRHDFQFPSTFAIRPPVTRALLDHSRAASVTGAGGELAVGYWYPPEGSADDDDRSAGVQAAMRNLLSATPAAALADGVRERERERIERIIGHAEGLGLTGLDLVDYAYLVERVRRWYTSAYYVGMVTPFLAPGFVMASFAVTPAQKRARLLHHTLLERMVPEWSQVPYVTGSSGTSKATRVWEGDGVQAACRLLDTAGGRLAGLVRPDAVEKALVRCVRGTASGGDERLLQQFTWLAAASEELEPDDVRPATGTTYARVTRPPGQRRPSPPTALSAVAARLRFVRRSRLGRAVWTAIRSRTLRP